jgi:hypothetical protein
MDCTVLCHTVRGRVCLLVQISMLLNFSSTNSLPDINRLVWFDMSIALIMCKVKTVVCSLFFNNLLDARLVKIRNN